MKIPLSAREALIQAYNYHKRKPEPEGKPKQGYEPVRATPRRTVRDKSKPWQPIVITPTEAMKAKQSRGGRTSTSGTIADLTFIVGPVLAAADSDCLSEFEKSWLQFAYNDDCEAQQKVSVHEFLWAYWRLLGERRSRQVNTDKMREYKDLAMIAMIEMRSRIASGRKPFNNAEKFEMLGLSKADRAHWGRSWQPHENDMLKILDIIDRNALQPVARVIAEKREKLYENTACI